MEPFGCLTPQLKDRCIREFGQLKSTDYVDKLQRLTCLLELKIKSYRTVALETFIKGLPGSLHRLVIKKDCPSASKWWMCPGGPAVEISLDSLPRELVIIIHGKVTTLAYPH